MNARIATGNRRRPWAEAAEVRGDRVVWMGSAAEAMKRRRAGCPVVELGGADVTAEAAALRFAAQRQGPPPTGS
ncbi:MAG: hypothetical protein ACK53A_09625 [Gemmatimonadota bacterium]